MPLSNKNSLPYIIQNGEKIFLEKEKEFITVYIYDMLQLNLIEHLDGIMHYKQVFNEVYRFRIDENKLEAVMDTIRLGLKMICHHAYRPIGTLNTRYYITDKITVKFKKQTSVEQIDALMDELGLKYIRHYNEQTYLLQVTSSSGMNPIKVAAQINTHKRMIAYGEPNLVSRFAPSFTPPDTKFAEQWHLKSTEAPELTENADIGVTQAWDITQGSRDIVIAVLDDGFDLSHPDLSGEGKVVFPKDFVTGTNNPIPGAGSFHGTPCAGLAIAEQNGDGVVGVAPKCAFMPVRIPFGADPNLLFEIFDYVGKRAHVISCSWGPPPVNAPLHQLIYDKITELAATGGPHGKGCVIVFAAHNFNAPLKDLENKQGISYLAGNRVFNHRDPIWNGNATHPDVIAVSASTSINRKAAYSNWGKEITVCAPSNNYHPLDFSIKLKGRGICTTDNFSDGSYFSPNSRYTTNFGGTSSAAPIVAGVAGLMLSVNPNLTAHQIKKIIAETADKITDTTPDIINNNQKGTYDANGHSEWFGYGKVNAYKAVQKAVALNQQLPDNMLNTADVALSPELLHSMISDKLTDTSKTKMFKLSVGKKLVIELDAINGEIGKDFDLFVKKGSEPTREDNDAASTGDTSSEKVIIENAEAGDYYVMVSSFKGEGDFELKMSIE